MSRMLPGVVVVFCAMMGSGRIAVAQEWRLRLGASAQLAEFRGVALDSVAGTDVLSGPTGGPITPDSIIARCPASADVCYFYRPGEQRRGGPLVGTTDLSLWGFGLSDLRIRIASRAGTDLGDNAWPGLTPAVQLLEAYAEYAPGRVTGRLGRQQLTGRLGWTAFDGARAIGRFPAAGVDVELYGGLGLGQATALPVSSPALDPLDEFQPRSRQLILGASLGWRAPSADVRLDYQREVDRDSRQFWSERAALSGQWRMAPNWSLTGGTEYDFSNSWIGTSDIRFRYVHPGLTASAGVRQYRPSFPLWTIWGAFSPVPYRAANGAITVTPARRLSFSLSSEYFQYVEAETETPLVQVDQDGWRTSLNAAFRAGARWHLSAGYQREYGPGASSDGVSAGVAYRASDLLTVRATALSFIRPLEFRLSESSVRRLGIDAAWQASPQLSLALGGAYVYENRNRPDAAAFDWRQTRLHARVSWLLSSGTGVPLLPPAVPGRHMEGVR